MWCKDDGVVRRREPIPLRDTLRVVADDLRSATPDVLSALSRCWVDVVGQQLAAHARPGGLVDGVLTILVDDPTVGSMFQQRRGTLARRWSEQLGPNAVRSLRVIVERPGRAAAE